MAEAFAALGIAANIFQFLELGFKATQTIITTYRDIDIDGLAQRNAEIASTCSDFEEHCSRLKNDKAVVKDADLAPLVTRCINTATKLSTEIGRLRVPDSKRHRKRTKVKMSIMSYWKSNTVEGLRADLSDIREQICFRLQGIIYEHHRFLRKSVDAWGEASKEWNRVTEQKLAVMAQQVQDLLESDSATQSSGVNHLAQTLAAFAEEAKSHGITRAILESLHFTQIKERQNEIPKAHKDTFKWIFSEKAQGNFPNWLRESSGIFWITGKPGSGKSTLMKFILGHKMMKDLAYTWAGRKPLLVASHFFWFGGTTLQKSQEGLLRTLLFQILSNSPELISELLPSRILGQFRYLESWSLEELSDAFERLKALPVIPCRILILVDGLDEYSGQGDELTEFLQAITESPDIKVCCASRPWQEFRNAFIGAFGRIQMHDLTSEDMRLYVQSTLRQNKRFKMLQPSQETQEELLIDSICAKAEGVFFWVSLVVKSPVRGLYNNDGLDTLQRRVSEFPPDLEQFFKRMIGSIEDVYKDQVDQVFSMLLMAKAPLPLTLFMARDSKLIQTLESKTSMSYFKFTVPKHSWHKRMRETPDTASNQSPIHHDELNTGDPGISELVSIPNFLNDRTKDQDPLVFRDQLLSWCRDLVQAWSPESTNSHLHGIRLGFLHRTVVEFLQRNWPIMRNRPFLNRYFLARSCLCVLDFHATDKAVNRDFILWFLFILQESDTATNYPAQHDGYMLFHRCEELEQILNNNKSSLLGDEDDILDGVLRLLAICQARILVQKHQLQLRYSRTNHVQYYENRNSAFILHQVLHGSGHVEVGDRPEAVLSNSIDLELLNNLLQMDGFKKHIMKRPDNGVPPSSCSVWETFVKELSHLAPGTLPPIEYEACQIMIRNGAAKWLKLDGQDDVDVIQYLRETNPFTDDEIGALEKLFPPELSTDERPSKKKRRKHAHRKGKTRILRGPNVVHTKGLLVSYFCTCLLMLVITQLKLAFHLI